MRVDAIRNGIVIDHITAGLGRKLYNLLGLENVPAPVALLTNVSSAKLGRKDIIKVDANIPVDFNVIGYVDPGATVNIIREGALVEKRRIEMPELLVNVIRCKNPRCITSCEQELAHKFRLTNREKKEYRCIYCETKVALL
jgi:aspartate carbamoyltransferase regulatory subunit